MTTGDEIRAAREARGMSQDELARAVGLKQPSIVKIESGQTAHSKFLPEIRSVLGMPGQNGTQPQDGPLNYRSPPQFLGERDLPVYSAVEGGPGAMVVSTDPIEWVQRPWFMREVKDGYAVVVTGESMVPVYEPGDIVIVNPRLPAIRNKNAIFVAGEERGEFRATVKRLERSTVKDWHVKQWNPPDGGPQELVLAKAEWPKALRIVGKYEGG